MNKRKMFVLGAVLAAYATVACVGLAFVYSATKETIEGHEKRDLEAALKQLFPSGDRFEQINGTISSPDSSVTFTDEYKVMDGSSIIGVAIRASGASYGGPIIALVGVGTDGKVSGAKILQNQDTPGLGANASSPQYFVDRPSQLTFYGQFAGKPVSDPFEVKSDVVAITASTITSKAVASVVKVSSQAGYAWLTSQGGVR